MNGDKNFLRKLCKLLIFRIVYYLSKSNFPLIWYVESVKISTESYPLTPIFGDKSTENSLLAMKVTLKVIC
jgi:hypothetical protein